MKHQKTLDKIEKLIDEVNVVQPFTAAVQVALGGLHTARDFLRQDAEAAEPPAVPVTTGPGTSVN